jgi:hypothetical protein
MPLHRILHVSLVMLLASCALLLPACSETSTDEEALRLEQARKLNSLSYVAKAPVRDENRGHRGVVRHDRQRAWTGLNLYASLSSYRAVLRDMDGEAVHTWQTPSLFPARATFPLGADLLDRARGPFAPGWITAELHDGDLLAIESHVGLVRLDAASNVVFALPITAHHDVDVTSDGVIHTLTAAPRRVPTPAGDVLVIDDFIQRIAPDGQLLDAHSILEILARDPQTRAVLAQGLNFAGYWFQHLDEWRRTRAEAEPDAAAALDSIYALYDAAFVQGARKLAPSHELFVLYHTPADVLHTNALQVLPGREDGLWREGDVLVSVRELDLIAVLDLEEGKVVWWWGPGELSRQHQPSLLENGDLLVFDNGTQRQRSRVIEVDPATRAIVRAWAGEPGATFLCNAMGGAQGLPNGNWLVTESSAGRALEIAPDGAVVWDFFNPDQGHNPFEAQDGRETIEAIYRLQRVAADQAPFLGRGR